MSKFGFKQLSVENWLIPDSMTQIFGTMSSDGSTREISGEEWLQDLLQPQLEDTVPLEVQKLFEVARGTMAYGYFFYPIYTLGIEQLFRVIEAAVAFKCKAMGAPPRQNYEKNIDWLIRKGVIPQEEFLRWEGIRGLRNIASHPKMQSIWTPVEALRYIESAANRINFIFTLT